MAQEMKTSPPFGPGTDLGARSEAGRAMHQLHLASPNTSCPLPHSSLFPVHPGPGLPPRLSWAAPPREMPPFSPQGWLLLDALGREAKLVREK